MILPDVNVLLYAHRRDADEHERYREWLNRLLDDGRPFAVADVILSSVLRIATNPRAYSDPSPFEQASAYVQLIRNASNCVVVREGAQHWDLFLELCRSVGARGNLMSDCYLAAFAIEHRCDWMTNDRHFARFPGLRSRHPFD